MTGRDTLTPWPGEPQACRCTRMVVGDLADTLDCPAGWRYAPGIGWLHVLPARWSR